MTIDTKEVSSGPGEWETLLEAWRGQDSELLNLASNEPHESEKTLSPSEQKETIARRQKRFLLQTFGYLVGEQRKDEYYPGTKVIKMAQELIRKPAVKEEVKKWEGVEDADLIVEETARTLDQAKAISQKRRLYAEMRKSEEQGDLRMALLMGIAVLSIGRIPPEQRTKLLLSLAGFGQEQKT